MLEELKNEVIKNAREAQRLGLCKHKSGNFSARDMTTGYICITPTGIDREILKTEDIVVMDEELNIIEGGKPSSESMMHVEIYKARKDIFGIAHTHSKMGTSFAVVNKNLPAIIYEVCAFNLEDNFIPVAPYSRPGTIDLALNVANTMKKNDLALMERHGTIACGKTLDEALLNVQYIEEVAEIYYYSLTINNNIEPKVFNREELDDWVYPSNFKGKQL